MKLHSEIAVVLFCDSFAAATAAAAIIIIIIVIILFFIIIILSLKIYQCVQHEL